MGWGNKLPPIISHPHREDSREVCLQITKIDVQGETEVVHQEIPNSEFVTSR